MMNEDSIKMEFVSLCNEQDRLYKPKFETVFKKLYKLDSTLSKNNPCTTDEALLDGALRLAGFENDEAFCADFKRYNAVFVEGKKLQARLCELLAKSCQGERQVGGWRFVSIGIKIIGSPELVKEFDDTMYNDAREGKGLFANVTEIPQEDEAMDEYLCVEAYGLKCSFVSFYDELKQFGIINGEKPFLSKELTNLLFVSLKQTATYIKEHTDKPQTTKNKIARLVKKFDSIPIWGLFLQILFLQGLCRLLECVNLNKGDYGYIEACSLMKWLCKRLAKKETDFCYTPYGDKDLDLLIPFCTYLNSTQLGQYVQSILFGNEPHRELKDLLPEELKSDEAKAYFEKAIEKGLMDENYKWLKGLQLLSCFAREMSLKLKLGKGDRISWKPFETLFHLNPNKLRFNYNDIQKTGVAPKDDYIIDEIFKKE